jgi:peptidoglycan/xylan/chitin deacetylase (PgdA/CDA1 family)
MATTQYHKQNFSPAFKNGLIALLLAGLLLIVDSRLAIIPLAAFVLLCLAAPFIPRFGFFLPVISRGKSGKNAVAITFDDGPDPLTAPALLKLLFAHQVQATFFITGRKAAAHPELVKEMVRCGHSIGNHSYRHSYGMLFKSSRSIARDIKAAQNELRHLRIRPLAFRPPAGITSPGLGPALSKIGMYLVNFSCRPLDGGNRRVKNLAAKILKRVRPDDIILLHDCKPPNEDLIPLWLNEIECLLTGLAADGFAVLPLSELIGRPVMQTDIKGGQAQMQTISPPGIYGPDPENS